MTGKPIEPGRQRTRRLRAETAAGGKAAFEGDLLKGGQLTARETRVP
jgi:hypothetical protein